MKKFVYLLPSLCLALTGCDGSSDEVVAPPPMSGDARAAIDITGLVCEEESVDAIPNVVITEPAPSYAALYAAYSECLNEPLNYGREPIDRDSLSAVQLEALQADPLNIFLKERAFRTTKNYIGDDKILYLLTTPRSTPPFKLLAQNGIMTSAGWGLSSTSYIAAYKNKAAIKPILKLPTIEGTARMSPLDKIHPDALMMFNQSLPSNIDNVSIRLISPNLLSAFETRFPDVIIDKTTVTKSEEVMTAFVPKNQLLDVLASDLVIWIANKAPEANAAASAASINVI